MRNWFTDEFALHRALTSAASVSCSKAWRLRKLRCNSPFAPPATRASVNYASHFERNSRDLDFFDSLLKPDPLHSPHRLSRTSALECMQAAQTFLERLQSSSTAAAAKRSATVKKALR